jgi:hypothetical protein
MAETKFSMYVKNDVVKNNPTYVNFLNDSRAFDQLQRDYVAGSISKENPISVKDSDGKYTQAFQDYVSLIINNPKAISALYDTTAKTQSQSGGKDTELIPKPVAEASETNANAAAGLNDYIVARMKEADPNLSAKTNAEILSAAAQQGVTPLLSQGYTNEITAQNKQNTTTNQPANTTTTTATRSKLNESFANYLVNNFKKDNPALVKNLTDAEILKHLESRQEGTQFKKYEEQYKKLNPGLETKSQNNVEQEIKLKTDVANTATVTNNTLPTANRPTENGLRGTNQNTNTQQPKTYASLGIDKSLTSNIATDYARRSGGDLSKDEKETFRQAMVQASLLKSIQSKTKGATLTKEDFIAMASTPAEKAMAAQVFDNASGGKNTISGYMAQDLVEGGLVDTVKNAVKNGEITTTTTEQKQQIRIA